MPYYLVTQISLVEAQDEQEAAKTGIYRLRSCGQVTVSVKSDETTITHIVVAAAVKDPSVSRSEAANPSPATVIPEPALLKNEDLRKEECRKQEPVADRSSCRR